MDPNYPSRLNDYLHFPESDDDTDSDFDPEDYATSEDDDEFEDSAEEDEDDLSHLDPANVITAGLYPHEREVVQTEQEFLNKMGIISVGHVLNPEHPVVKAATAALLSEEGFKDPPKSAIVPTENKETPVTTRDLKEYLKPS